MNSQEEDSIGVCLLVIEGELDLGCVVDARLVFSGVPTAVTVCGITFHPPLFCLS